VTDIVRGLLGWSNKRAGLELYRYDPQVIPRHGSEWGDLLVAEPAFVDREGAAVLVVVCPRDVNAEGFAQVEAAVAKTIAELDGRVTP
jgi:hypothetical protein